MKERLKKFDFLGHRKIYYIFCIVLIIVSIGVGMIRGYNLGIDFTGGTMIEIEMGEQIDLGRVEDVLSETEIDGACDLCRGRQYGNHHQDDGFAGQWSESDAARCG